MSLGSNDNLDSSFPVWMPLFFFFPGCPGWNLEYSVASESRQILLTFSWSQEERIQSFTIKYDASSRISLDALYQIEGFLPFPYIYIFLIRNGCWIFWNAFSESMEIIILFSLSLLIEWVTLIFKCSTNQTNFWDKYHLGYIIFLLYCLIPFVKIIFIIFLHQCSWKLLLCTFFF